MIKELIILIVILYKNKLYTILFNIFIESRTVTFKIWIINKF